MPDGRFIVAHSVRIRGTPSEVERLLKNTASQDGVACVIALPQDPAQAGKAQAAHLLKHLAGYRARFAPASGDKVPRFGAFSAQAEGGNVLVLLPRARSSPCTIRSTRARKRWSGRT